jgi:putative SOS response-associated peptidase YedK
MCGRYTIRTVAARMAAAFQAGFDEFSELRIVPRFNVAPSQRVPVVHLRDGKRLIGLASWGFVPAWSEGTSGIKPINAKAETVATSGLFRSAFKSSRCLLPADGFYEWKPGTPKRPYFFHRPGDGLFAFAGLRSRRDDRSTCLLLTTTPNDVVKIAHNRMPVILPESDYDRWLDLRADPAELQSLLVAYPESDLTGHPVGPRVGSPANDDPSLVDPARDSISGLF